MTTLSNTTQQINTLLAQLENHAFKHAILFAKPLSQIAFDYTPDSIARLNQLLTQLAKKDYTLDSLLQQQGGTNFFLSIAAYLANYLAKSTDEPIVWLNYTEALTEIHKKNREYGTDFSLDKDFDNSLVAKIGDGMFCRPLQAVRATLANEGDITGFIDEMQTSIFDRSYIDIADTPDSVPQRYLAKIRDGKLRDTTIAFFDDIKHIEFDFSEKSLHQIDTALAHIRQTHHLSESQYLEHINDPEIQALCYVLGFYLGVTTGKLTQRPVHWASFSQAKAMLGTPINYSLEHSIVLLSENHYHTPMLAISNALFGFTDYPRPSEFVQKFLTDTQDEFAHPTADTLQWFAFNRENSELPTEKSSAIPSSWQMAMTLAGRLLAHDLLAIFDGGELSPNLYELNVETKKANVRTLAEHSPNINQATHVKHIETLYQELKTNPKNLPLLVASFDSQLNLTTGKIPAIVVEIRVYQEPKLALQLILPYRPASSEAGFAIFPIAYHAQNALAKRQPQAHKILTTRLSQLVDMLYLATQKVPSPMHTGSFWDNYYLPISLENKENIGLQLSHTQEKSSLLKAEEHTPAEQISLSLLEPIAVQHKAIAESTAIENDEFKQHPSLQNQAIQDTTLPTAILQKPDLQNQELPNHNKQTTLVQEPLLQEFTSQDLFAKAPVSQTPAVQNPSSQIPATQNLTSQNSNFPNLQQQDLIPKEPALENPIPQSQASHNQASHNQASQNQFPQVVVETKIQAKTDTKTDAKTKAELIEKLRQDQARLQTELSTSDEGKDKKLIYISVAVVVVIVVMMLMSKMMK